jgi:tRNA dimethylallyltransferase
MTKLKEKLIIVILGPTGVGKTELSIQISGKFPVEILSADSRQLFRYLDIGTAKPAESVLKMVPHHFINMLNPDEYYSAGRFGRDARQKIEEIFDKKKVPLIVGGSGLYVKSLLEGFFEGELRNENIRGSLLGRLEKEGSQQLYQDLLKIDEVTAKRLHPHNGKQIIRALEVYLSTGEQLSELQKKQMPAPEFQSLKFGLVKERQKLYEDIDRRVDQMFTDGLLAEVARILEMDYDKSLNSLNTVGYKEVIQYIDGKIDYETCVNLIKRNSRRYAKRQLTWFKPDEDIHWFKVEGISQIPEIASKIIEMYLHTNLEK